MQGVLTLTDTTCTAQAPEPHVKCENCFSECYLCTSCKQTVSSACARTVCLPAIIVLVSSGAKCIPTCNDYLCRLYRTISAFVHQQLKCCAGHETALFIW